MMQVSISFEKPEKYAKGGLAGAAQKVRNAGRHGDSILVHVNPEEFSFLKEHFGPGSVNPQTGLPQFNFWDALIPIAANILLPGVGGAIGSAVTGALGVGADLAPMIGGAILGGGASALTGGDFGTGALAGGLSQPVISALGIGGSGTNILSSLLGGGGGSGGAAAAAANPGDLAMGGFGTGNVGAGAAAAGTGVMSSIMKAAPLLLAASALGPKPAPAAPPPTKQDLTHLQPVEFTRQQLNPDINASYGYGSEKSFFGNNQLPTTQTTTATPTTPATQVKAAMGQYVKGGGTGTSDSIPAKLSDGEYVIDAQTVSMLGNGSSDAGAKKLDQMREDIRKHKGGALSKGRFPPDAKSPLSYLRGN